MLTRKKLIEQREQIQEDLSGLLEGLTTIDQACQIVVNHFQELLKVFDSGLIRNAYPECECPDCGEDIPEDVVDGQACSNCGHVFYLPPDVLWESIGGEELDPDQ